ncbi:hypothetical protein E2C01_057375 [Portunus trituberculatus]|uniref:Uncharacterized protein n=1 Tax=Portunus trituberculatus TaxID=210409 RepID=A0A5B7H059_PORTR|nr:hypothetical protein [Portunus trituberculatus]
MRTYSSFTCITTLKNLQHLTSLSCSPANSRRLLLRVLSCVTSSRSTTLMLTEA